MGSINLYVGCMFSGKTSTLIRECRRCITINKKVLCINYDEDNRYSDADYIISHNQDKIDCIKVHKLADIPENIIKEHDFIMIDEGQFFTDIKDYVIKWCDEFKKHIVIIGLDGDYRREKFGNLLELIPCCDNIVKLKALCQMCNDGTEALFTHRLSHENAQVVIGSNNYIPLCRKHFLENN